MQTEPEAPGRPPAALIQPTPGSGEMFDRIAARYDLLNRILSLNVDHRWRKSTIKALQLNDGGRLLDLATGTADMALLTHRVHPKVTIVGLDPSQGMLEVGRRKVEAIHAGERISLLKGDAQHLPFESDSFDACCIAFGIRNVPDRLQALKEMNRVVRPGGRIGILELSEPKSGVIALGARFYIQQLVPRIGALLSGKEEYRYLQTSVSAFPQPDVFAGLMQKAGMKVLEVRPMLFGVCQLFVAEPGGSAVGGSHESA